MFARFGISDTADRGQASPSWSRRPWQEHGSRSDPTATAFAMWAAGHGAVLVILPARADAGLPPLVAPAVVRYLMDTLLDGLAT